MHRFIRLAVTLAAFTLPVMASGVAHATEPATVTLKATVKSTPDDGCPAWARDTFTRTTTITGPADGKYKVTIKDSGTFATHVGADSPGDPAVKIATEVTGSIEGSGEYTVTGILLDTETLANLDGDTYNNGSYACKANVPSDRTTAKWPLKFFTQGATTTGIDPWKWTYKTACETRTESSTADPVGNITGKVCPSPSPSVSASASGTVSPTPSTSTSAAAVTLPVTGTSGTLLVVGLAAILVGGAAIVVTRRRRKVEFTAE